MEQQSQPKHSRVKNLKARTIIPWVGSILFVIIIAVMGYLFVTKQLVLALGAGSEKAVTVQSHVCGSDVIGKFNDIYTADSGNKYTSILKTAFDAATAKSGYINDPNCVYIRYSYYVAQKDTSNAQKELDTLKTLAGQGSYATSQLSGVQTIDDMQAAIDFLKNPAVTDPTSGQSSGGQG